MIGELQIAAAAPAIGVKGAAVVKARCSVAVPTVQVEGTACIKAVGVGRRSAVGAVPAGAVRVERAARFSQKVCEPVEEKAQVGRGFGARSAGGRPGIVGQRAQGAIRDAACRLRGHAAAGARGFTMTDPLLRVHNGSLRGRSDAA